MALVASPSVVTPSVTVAMPAICAGARAAAIPLVLSPNVPSILLNLQGLPPNQVLGPLGTVQVDNTANPFDLQVSFPDTGATNDIPALSSAYILALTGQQNFSVSSPVTDLVPITVVVLNVVVNPTGSVAGAFAISNAGPVAVTPLSRSKTVGAAVSTALFAANPARKAMMFAMPLTSDGWVNFLGGAAGPGLADSFYMTPGQSFTSPDWVPQTPVNVYVTSGGMVPAMES